MLFSSGIAEPLDPDWKIIQPMFPTPDIVVAGYNVLDFGAVGDGKTDCTDAIQSAIDSMSLAGGGTVFVPSGRYVVKGTLIIPTAVTLRGEWTAPTNATDSVQGTVLMAYAGRGNEAGHPFITVCHSSGIKDLSIWYPEQSKTKPVPYPFCLIQKSGDNATFENLTLVNPYQGIKIGPGGNELHFVRNVYGTPLKVGVEYDSTTDIGRLENIHFSPSYWRNSGLKNAPPEGKALDEWLLENGTALHMFRSDWEYVAYIYIDGYNHGYLVSKGVKGAANAQFYALSITNCTTALEVEEANAFGMVFAQCQLYGIEYGVRLRDTFASTVLFADCAIGGEQAIHADCEGNTIVQNSDILSGDVVIDRGTLAMTSCTLHDRISRVRLGEKTLSAALCDNDYAAGRKTIEDKSPNGALESSDQRVDLESIPVYDARTSRPLRPPEAQITVVSPGGSDDTGAIQTAMNQLAANGGGIVFLPAGDYLIYGELSVPTGVELRGIYDVPHHTKGAGSILQIYPQNPETPTIVLNASSGMRGLSFNYPEQNINDLKDYPFLLQGRGADIYIVDINAANPYRFLDLASHQCDNHYVDYLSGAPLLVGITVGANAANGDIRNMQFNPHYWGRAPDDNPYFDNRPRGGTLSGGDTDGTRLWTQQKEHLEALIVGDTQNQMLFQNFVFGSLYGIRYTMSDGGTGPVNCINHGHGTDGSKVGVYFEKGHGKITMINSELVAMSSENKTGIKLGPDFDAQAVLINTMVWGQPDLLVEQDNGELLLQGLHCTQHGEGIRVNEGTVLAINVQFKNKRGNHLSLVRKMSKAELIGCITDGPLLINNDSEVSSKLRSALDLRANITRTRKR